MGRIACVQVAGTSTETHSASSLRAAAADAATTAIRLSRQLWRPRLRSARRAGTSPRRRTLAGRSCRRPARTDELHFGGTRVDGGGHDAAPLPGPAHALTRGERPARADQHLEAERGSAHDFVPLRTPDPRGLCFRLLAATLSRGVHHDGRLPGTGRPAPLWRGLQGCVRRDSLAPSRPLVCATSVCVNALHPTMRPSRP